MTRGSGQSNIHFPSHRQQIDRLGPKFRELQRVFGAQRAELRQDPGLEPERVLVLETVDGVEDFIKAVRRIPGMEWMAEWEEEAIDPDENFYKETDPEGALRGRLYLVMFNREAMNQLVRLWNTYRRSPTERLAQGLNKWRNVFARLRDLRFWDSRDRVDQNLVHFWEGQLAGRKERIAFKAELWFSASPEKRLRNQRTVELLVREEGGQISAEAVMPEIAFHALAGELPPQAARRIIDLQETRFSAATKSCSSARLARVQLYYPVTNQRDHRRGGIGPCRSTASRL